jgi:general secretion pathway protein D
MTTDQPTTTSVTRASCPCPNRSHGQDARVAKRGAILTLIVAAAAALPPTITHAQTTQSFPATATHNITTQPGGGLLLNFKDASIDSVLDELSRAAGFIIVKTVQPQGRVTLVSKQPVKPDDAVSLLNTVLKDAGYAAIQQGRILKIVPRDQARHANIPVHSGADPSKIADTDELITQVIPLRQADAMQLKNDLAPLINTTEADFTANASSNSLIITDTSANVKRIVEIVSALDNHLVDSAEVKVFQLQYADASSAAKLINDLFGEQAGAAQNQNNPFARFFRGRGNRGNGNDNNNQQTRQTAKVLASADDRTNTVVVTGPRDTLEIISGVVQQLDSNPASEQTVYIYHLKNAQAQTVQDVLNYLFNGAIGPSVAGAENSNGFNGVSSLGGFGGGGGNSGGIGGSSRGGLGGFGSITNNARGSTGSRSTNAGGRSSGVGQLSPAAQQAAQSLAGQVTIIADPDTNSLLIRTAPKNYPDIQLILHDLDRAVPQVLIKVLVAEVTHDNNIDIGAEFAALNLRANGNGSKAATDFGLKQATGGLTATVLETNFQATLHALESMGKLDVLSRPYILASDNQLASIIVGQSVPIPINSQITDTGNIINSLEYVDVGIILNVTPHINPEGLVILDVNPEISSLTGQTVAISNGVGAPVFDTRSAMSRVGVLDGKTIVIGGLMEDKKTETVTQVPFLGSIPIIGELFKRHQQDKTKTELLIFLTPHVAESPEQLKQMSQDELNGTQLVPNAVYPGAFQEHMKGMHRGEASAPAATQPTTAPVGANP